MKLLFASDSFKGSLTSRQTIELLTKAAHEVFGDCETDGVSVADGGEGTVDAVVAAQDGKTVQCSVHDPLMQTIESSYGVIDDNQAVIEMAAASGLTLVPENLRNPMNTTTFGTGELILDALNRGYRKISIAIGGSATNDGGMGCARALGVRFLDKDGNELEGYGRDLINVNEIDASGLDERLRLCNLTVMCDVKNPLCGKDGATMTFGAQKGAAPCDLEKLEEGMCHYRDVINKSFGIDCDNIEGAGAAGGLGAALCVFLHGTMKSGIENVLDIIHFDERLSGVDLVITGEGRTDWQSCFGKVMQGVGLRAKAKGIPVLGLSGSLGKGAMDICSCGISSLMTTVNSPMSLEDAMKNAETLYYEAAVRMFRTVRTGMDLNRNLS
ncbi:MAG: glycerate kinase [Lachnospiraceae bacterium]|nr:glycerate kinase [Lachnospiraceae bacterium]